MENKKIMTILLFTIVGLITLGYVVGFLIYMDYRQKTAYFDKQTRLAINKFEEVEENLKNLYLNLEDAMDENRVEKQELLDKIEIIKEDMRDWKTHCGTVLSEIKGEIDQLEIDKLTRTVKNMRNNIDSFKMKVQDLDLKIDEATGKTKFNVDLGKISVKK